MGFICFIIGFFVGFITCSVFSINTINDAYENGYKEGKEENVSEDK